MLSSKFRLFPILVVFCSTISASVFAHNSGDFFARGGLAYVSPNESSDDVNGNGELAIDDVLKIGGTLTYMMSDNYSVEVLLGLPFTHEVSNENLGGQVAEVSHLPLSVVAQYYFAEANSDIRPYVGAGFNYTTFLDEKGVGALATTDVYVDNSFGLAVQAGVDINLKDNWFVNASVWYLDIETKVHADGSGLPPINVTINPLAVLVGVGYTF